MPSADDFNVVWLSFSTIVICNVENEMKSMITKCLFSREHSFAFSSVVTPPIIYSIVYHSRGHWLIYFFFFVSSGFRNYLLLTKMEWFMRFTRPYHGNEVNRNEAKRNENIMIFKCPQIFIISTRIRHVHGSVLHRGKIDTEKKNPSPNKLNQAYVRCVCELQMTSVESEPRVN